MYKITKNFNDHLLKSKILNLLKRYLSNIPLINNELRLHLFGKQAANQSKYNIDEQSPQIDLKLPKLFENNIEKHFLKISHDQVSYYSKLADKLCSSDIPLIPNEFKFTPGWTKYMKDGSCVSVDYPDADVMVFDVETLVTENSRPVIAVATSSHNWYSWCSNTLFRSENDQNSIDYSKSLTLDDLIPLESTDKKTRKSEKRIIIAHNSGFDRSFIKEQYLLEKSGLRFIDTMSMHIACSGFCSEQRELNYRNNIEELNTNDSKKFQRQTKPSFLWRYHGSLNNLKDVHKFYCPESNEIKKDNREIFIKGDINDVKKEFQALMIYCANDVRATYEVFRKLFKIYTERFSHDITFAGMLEMSTMYLPTDKSWLKYINNCKNAFDDTEYLIKKLLERVANEACEFLDFKDNDPWMFDLDWRIKELKLNKKSNDSIKNDYVDNLVFDKSNPINKTLNEKDLIKVNNIVNELNFSEETKEVFSTAKYLPKLTYHLYNYPNWYRDLCLSCYDPNWMPGPCLITFKTRIVANLLRLTWKGYPLIYSNSSWNYLKPKFKDEIKKIENIDFSNLNENGILNFFKVVKIFSSTSKSYVNYPLTKALSYEIETDILNSCPKGLVKTIFQLKQSVGFWFSFRNRIISQNLIWLNSSSACILPRTIVHGSISRKPNDYLWQFASNYHECRIGCEIKGAIRCPENYSFVGADLSYHEMIITALIGESGINWSEKSFGMTSFTNFIYQSDKDNNILKNLEQEFCFTRDKAMQWLHSYIYGADINKLVRQLGEFCHDEDDNENLKIKLKAKLGFEIEENEEYGLLEKMKIYFDGLIFKDIPKTPVLESYITKCLEPKLVQNDFLPARKNWLFQSSTVDFVNIMLVCMNWLIEEYKIDARLSYCLQDEIRYIVNDKHKYQAALALQISNLYSMSYFCSKLGFDNLPQSIAFLKSIQLDKCMRKDTNSDMKSPSNPNGLKRGYGVPTNEFINISELMNKMKGEKNF